MQTAMRVLEISNAVESNEIHGEVVKNSAGSYYNGKISCVSHTYFENGSTILAPESAYITNLEIYDKATVVVLGSIVVMKPCANTGLNGTDSRHEAKAICYCIFIGCWQMPDVFYQSHLTHQHCSVALMLLATFIMLALPEAW